MAGSVNKVILVGNLGRDPESRAMQSGDKVVNLSVATSESWRDRQTGERREKTEWHRVVIFDQNLVEIAEKYLQKGSKVKFTRIVKIKMRVNEVPRKKFAPKFRGGRGRNVAQKSAKGGVKKRK